MMENQKTRSIAFNFVPINDEETEIEIYDVIASKKSYDWWNDAEGTEVTPNGFKEQLKAVTTNNITVRMNSAGGEVTAATVIAGAIQEAKQAGKNITCKIDGMCASAAVQIAISCNKTVIHPSALMMIHNPMLFMYGYYDVQALAKEENCLNATKDAIINFYEEKTGLSRQKLSNMMDSETWMNGKEAVEKGFADELMFGEIEDDAVVNKIRNVYATACMTGGDPYKLPESYQVAINQLNTPQKGEEQMEVINNVQELMNQYPELVNQIKDEAVATIKNDLIKQGIEQERERMKAIDELGDKISAELINKAKYETFDSAENVAMEAIKTGAFKNTGVMNALQEETEDANGVAGVPNNGNAENPVDEKKVAKNKASEIAKNHFKKIGKAGE